MRYRITHIYEPESLYFIHIVISVLKDILFLTDVLVIF